MKYWLLGIAVLGGLYGLHRIAVWAERRGWIYYRRGHGRSGAIGNALVEVHAIVEPSARYALEERVKEDVEADEAGDPPGREPPSGTIHLASYDPDWPAAFERHARRVRDALGTKVLLLEHVGSTSVPGLAAKPIIDMVLAVADSTDEASYVPPLEERGFALRIREPDWFEHRLLKSPDDDVNLHVFPDGCEEIGRMLAFRDRLRTHEDDRRLYEQTKRTLAARSWKHVQDYADAKSTVVQDILARALKPCR